MTLPEFLAKLRETPREWRICDGGRITLGSAHCPYTAVEDSPDMNTVIAIWASADNNKRSKRYDPALRAQLLDACGLPPEGV